MTKKAVLIGVNRYRIPGNDLRGCVPDVKNMANLLQRQYEFESGDISLITDFDATKEAIQSAVTGLIREARRGCRPHPRCHRARSTRDRSSARARHRRAEPLGSTP